VSGSSEPSFTTTSSIGSGSWIEATVSRSVAPSLKQGTTTAIRQPDTALVSQRERKARSVPDQCPGGDGIGDFVPGGGGIGGGGPPGGGCGMSGWPLLQLPLPESE
jgi:hypothetical protein